VTTKARFRVFAAVSVMLVVPRAALACPVCFGNSDAPMAIATNTGVLFMLGVVAVVLAAFASFFVYLIRRANRTADQTAPADAARLAPSEGTAQC
jgi:bacteriorhodopsin